MIKSTIKNTTNAIIKNKEIFSCKTGECSRWITKDISTGTEEYYTHSFKTKSNLIFMLHYEDTIKYKIEEIKFKYD